MCKMISISSSFSSSSSNSSISSSILIDKVMIEKTATKKDLHLIVLKITIMMRGKAMIIKILMINIFRGLVNSLLSQVMPIRLINKERNKISISHHTVSLRERSKRNQLINLHHRRLKLK